MAEIKCPYAEEVAALFDIHIDCQDCWRGKCPHPEVKEAQSRKDGGGK